MKVKNIVFSGFAAAVLMGVAADANAVTHVVTKGFIDGLDLTEVGAAGSYIQKVRQADGQVAAEPIQFDTEINEQDIEHTNAPTSKAVREYVAANDTTYIAGDYIDIDENNAIAVDDITETGQDIDTGDTGLTTGNAVYEYVTSAVNGIEYSGDEVYITVDEANNEIGLTNLATDASGITDTSTALTTGKAVYDYVTDNAYTGTGYVSIDVNNKISVNDVTDSGTDINDTDTGLTTGNAVHEYVTGAVNALDNTVTADAGKYVSGVTQTDGKVVSVATTGFDTAISQTNPSETTAPTTKAVVDYVTQLTGGVLPTTDCTSGNCALVKIGSTVQWVDLTTPLQDQTTGG